MSVKLLIDSTNYLPTSVVTQNEMRQVSLFINDGGRHDREMNLEYAEFYQLAADMVKGGGIERIDIHANDDSQHAE